MDIHKLPPSLTPLDLPEPSDESAGAGPGKPAASPQGVIAPDNQFPDVIQSGPKGLLVDDLQLNVVQNRGEGGEGEGGGEKAMGQKLVRTSGEGGGGPDVVGHDLRQVGGEGGGGKTGGFLETLEQAPTRMGGEGGGGPDVIGHDLRQVGGEGGGGKTDGFLKTMEQEPTQMGGEGGGGEIQDAAPGVWKLAAGDRKDVQPDEDQQPGPLDPNLIQHHKPRRA